MSKLIKEKGYDGRYIFHCPGCDEYHVVYSKEASPECQPQWDFNGDLERPTFSPSLLYRTGHFVKGQPQPPNCRHCNDPDFIGTRVCTVCHSFMRDGKIEFLSDCTHHLAGKTVDMAEVE